MGSLFPIRIAGNKTQCVTILFFFLSILNYTPYLPRAVVEESIEKAFQVWSDVTPLTFSRVFEEEGDIVLAFYRGGKFFNLTLPFHLSCFVEGVAC